MRVVNKDGTVTEMSAEEYLRTAPPEERARDCYLTNLDAIINAWLSERRNVKIINKRLYRYNDISKNRLFMIALLGILRNCAIIEDAEYDGKDVNIMLKDHKECLYSDLSSLRQI